MCFLREERENKKNLLVTNRYTSAHREKKDTTTRWKHGFGHWEVSQVLLKEHGRLLCIDACTTHANNFFKILILIN
jgi:hypothetical protein